MARRRIRRWHHKFHKPKMSLLTTIGVSVPLIRSILGGPTEGGTMQPVYNTSDGSFHVENLFPNLAMQFLGYQTWNGQFNFGRSIKEAYLPIVVGALGSRFLGPLVNKKLAAIPMVGKYIRL